MAPSFLSMRGLLALGALCTLALAERAEPLAQRDAMLSPRQRTCRTPGWIPACPGAFPCIPPGGICCDDGITYVMPPRSCPDGTQPIATAVTSVAVPSITTAPPVPTTLPPVTQYEWYTWTIRVTYYYYYYTYFAFSASLTSSESTYSTTGSLTASNDAQATALISSIGASISSSVKSAAQTATPTVGDVPTSTVTPVETATATATVPVATAPTTVTYPAGNTTMPAPPLRPTSNPTEFTGAASALRAGTSALFGSAAVVAGVVGMMVPGVLMIAL